jgi:6-phosphogluconolactonase
MTQPQAILSTIYAYVGTYTDDRREGIFIFKLDPASGKLAPVGAATGLPSPSFLAIHPSKRYLYAVNEVGDFGGKSAGAVSAFAIDAKTGALKPINQQSSVGTGPAHIIVDATGKFALVANYGGGSVALLPIKADGSLAPASDFVQHSGSSVNKQRQEGPHAHSTTLDPANRVAFVADLGLDKLLAYQLDATREKLAPNAPPFAQVKPGAGPRHFAFHPQGKHAYVINELDSTVTAFAYDAARGALREVQTIGTLPAGISGINYCADIHVSPTGKFLYGSNRGHDSIVIFAIDGRSGKLSLVGHQSTLGKWPRNFALDPTNQFLFVANQNSDDVVCFRMNTATGALTPTGQTLRVPKPVCVKFVVV